MKTKQICPVHRFSYSGDVCPFCEKERLDNLAKRYVTNEEREALRLEKKNEKMRQRGITEEDLNKLKEKFGK